VVATPHYFAFYSPVKPGVGFTEEERTEGSRSVFRSSLLLFDLVFFGIFVCSS